MNEEKRLHGTWVITNFTKKSGNRIKSDIMKFGEEQLKFVLDNHNHPNQNVQISIKIENFKSKELEFNAKFELINKDEAKTLKVSEKFEINQSSEPATIQFPVKGLDFIDEWVDNDEVKIKYDISSSDNASTNDNEEQQSCSILKNDSWEIADFERASDPIESSDYIIQDLTFKLIINRPKDYSSNETKFSIIIKSVKLDSKNKSYTFKIELMNEMPSKSAIKTVTHQFEKEDEKFDVDFDLTYKEFTESNGFLYQGGASIRIKYANYDFSLSNDESDNDFDSGKTNYNYDITNYNYSNNYSTYSAVSTDSSKQDTGYVGLRNQGATCYMNSMLQSLFHLPAFRKLVYRMHTTGTEDVSKSIPLCLQRLFVYMQCSDKACSTKALTKSFGWDDYQTIVQHDVQEFCRVLIDNLEEKMKNTELDGEIAKLFRGKYRSFIRCINVPFETSKEEYFYDIQLVVKDTPDLATSFSKYIEPEILAGDDQYNTEKYGKQDVKMGTEFLEFPSILQIHLRRFEYDFNYDQMTKINSRFEFPATIDLSQYLAENADKTKPNIFDLYGVLVHSGSTTSGHYYAFLRTSTGPQWYQFNDSHVTTATATESIDENFGGSSSTSTATSATSGYTGYTYGYGGYSYNNSRYYYSYNTEKSYSAYMLVYIRRSDAEKIFTPVSNDEIPEHLMKYFKDHPDEEETTTYSISTSNELNVNVIPEEGIIVNSILGKSGFECTELQKSFSFTKGQDNDKILYEKVAHEFGLQPNQIRLWTTYYQFAPYSICSNKDTSLTTSTSLFLQKKSEDEDLEVDKKLVVFMKFFDVTLSVPIQFLGTTLLDKSEPVSTLFPLVLQKLGLPENLADNLLVYQEYSSYAHALDKDRTFKSECSNVQCLIFQFEQKLGEEEERERISLLNTATFKFYTKDDLPKYLAEESSKSKSEKDDGESTDDKEKKEKEKEEENKEEEKYKDLHFFTYLDVIGVQKVKDINQYLQSLRDPVIAVAFDYEDITKPIAKVQFSPSLYLDDLKKFVAKAMKLDYNPEKDLLLIYKKNYYEDEPSSDPIQSETVTHEFYSYNKQILRMYYRLIHDMTKEKMENMMTIEVSISEDGYNVSKKKKILIEKDATIASIKDQILKLINIDPNDSTNQNKYRISKISDHKYDGEYKDLSSTISAYDKNVRFDIIPQEQLELIQKEEVKAKDEADQSSTENNENIILVQGSHLTTEYSRAKNCEDPFFFILDKRETYDQLVNRVKEVLKLDSFKRSKILISDDNPTISQSTPFMKADKTVGDYIESLNLTKEMRFYIFHPPHQSSSKNEAVKIIN